MRKRSFITLVTHNSRYNEKMKLLKLEKGEGYFLDDEKLSEFIRLGAPGG